MTIAATRPTWIRKHLFAGVWSSLVTDRARPRDRIRGLRCDPLLGYVRLHHPAEKLGPLHGRGISAIPTLAGWSRGVVLAFGAGIASGLINAAARLRLQRAGLPVAAPPGPHSLVNSLRRYWPLGLFMVVCLLLTQTITPTLVVMSALTLLIGATWVVARLPILGLVLAGRSRLPVGCLLGADRLGSRLG